MCCWKLKEPLVYRVKYNYVTKFLSLSVVEQVMSALIPCVASLRFTSRNKYINQFTGIE